MREVDVRNVTDAIQRMCIEINHDLSDDMKQAISEARKR